MMFCAQEQQNELHESVNMCIWLSLGLDAAVLKHILLLRREGKNLV